jgi:hypothetical protein
VAIDPPLHDLVRLSHLRAAITAYERGVRTADPQGEDNTASILAIFRQKVADIERAWTDERVAIAHREQGHAQTASPEAAAVKQEYQRRGLCP